MKFGKKVLSMLLATGMVMSLAACGGNSDSAATTTDSSDNASAEAASDSAASGEVKTIRISHGQPETHPEHLGLLEFEKYIEENLGDKYQVEIYPNAIMGGTQAALEAMKSGSLDMVVGAASDLEAFNPEYRIFGLPYVFESADHMKTVMDNEEFMAPFYNSTTDSGIVGVSWFYAGTRSF